MQVGKFACMSSIAGFCSGIHPGQNQIEFFLTSPRRACQSAYTRLLKGSDPLLTDRRPPRSPDFSRLGKVQLGFAFWSSIVQNGASSGRDVPAEGAVQ